MQSSELLSLLLILRLLLVIVLVSGSRQLLPPDPGNNNNQQQQQELCPLGCNPTACGVGILTCNDHVLTRLPRQPPLNTVKVLLIRQDFQHASTLAPDNFTMYAPPTSKIKKVTIQNSSIRAILPGAFSGLTDLETLDLSHNDIGDIPSSAFRRLSLNFLRLDGNHRLLMTSQSFQGLQVAWLSLKDCFLSQLAYDIFKPIAQTLERLLLSKNRLTTLEVRFRPLFRQLTLVALADNPFDCGDCRLQWLVDSMRQIRLRHQINKQEAVYPYCVEPQRLRNRTIDSLSLSTDFQCPIAAVRSISVLILPNNSASLTCTANHVQSPVHWEKLFNQQGNGGPIMSRSKFSSTQMVTQAGPVDGYACVVSNTGSTSQDDRSRGSLGEARTRLQIAWPPLLPRFNYTLVGMQPPSSSSEQEPPLKPPSSSNSDQSYFFQPQFSLIEMIAGVVGTFIGTLVMFIAMLRCLFFKARLFTTRASKHAQFHDSHFSQHHTHPHHHQQHPSQPHYNSYLQSYSSGQQPHLFDTSTTLKLATDAGTVNTNNNHNNSGTQKRCYNSYEPPNYSDSQTYDTPNIHNTSSTASPAPPLSTSISSPPLPLPPPLLPLPTAPTSASPSSSSPPPPHLASNTLPHHSSSSTAAAHFLDFKTQRTVYGID